MKQNRIIIFLSMIFFVITLQSEEKQKVPKLGLVLSGGGAKGFAHIGVIKILEKEGIIPDYITGTSMGAVVGGFYACGYNAKWLEKKIKANDWKKTLREQINRRSLSIEEKRNADKYITSFPIDKFKITLPTGLITGQSLSMVLNRLSIPFHNIHDYSKLEIPFACISTNLETGEAVVMNSGFLSESLRATMSIPSILKPMDLDGKLLIDGGIVRNLPVTDILEMGADIVIAVDVGQPLFKRNELNNLINVINQTVAFMGVSSTEEQKKLCDILITPDMKGFNSISFDAVDSLISRGEQATIKQLPEIKKFLSKKGFILKDTLRKEIIVKDHFSIKKITIEGLHDVSKKLVLGYLQIKENKVVSLKKIERGIRRVYASRFFESVNYYLIPENGHYTLLIKVKEQISDYFQIGGHYDSDQKASVYLSTTYKNFLLENSTFSFEAKLSENPEFKAKYRIFTSGVFKFGLDSEFIFQNFNIFTYDSEGETNSSLDFKNYVARFSLEMVLFNSYAIGGGLEPQKYFIKGKISSNDKVEHGLLDLFAFIDRDSFDRTAFPTRGSQVHIEIKSAFESITHNLIHEQYQIISASLKRVITLTPKIKFLFNTFSGASFGETPPILHNFYLGGYGIQKYNVYPFAGKRFMEISGENAFVLATGIRYEFIDNYFITLKGNIGKVSSEYSDLFIYDDLLYGVASTFGVLTDIGPVELSLLKERGNRELKAHISIGYEF